MIRIYISNGNGKTLTAIGNALTAAGEGKKVIFTQFLTNGEDSELKMLQSVERVAVLLPEPVKKTFANMEIEEKHKVKKDMSEHYEKLMNLVMVNCCDMLVLDRILDVCDYGLIDCTNLIKFLKQISDKMEIILTGEKITPEVEEMTDYISDIRKINDIDTQYYVGMKETINEKVRLF